MNILLASEPTSLLASVTSFLEMELAVAVVAVVFTFLGPLVAVPGETRRNNRLTRRGWLAICVTVIALAAQATKEWLQETASRARAVAVDEGIARLETKLEVMLASANGGTAPPGTIAGKAAEPAPGGPTPSQGFPFPGAGAVHPGSLPADLRSELEALRKVAGR
jgi:hypothetical protein